MNQLEDGKAHLAPRLPSLTQKLKNMKFTPPGTD